MKKTLIALALMSVAGTAAAAKTVQVQADVFSGKEHLKTFTAVVEDGKPVEIRDKEILAHFGGMPSAVETGNTPVTPQVDGQASELGFILKMTPVVLPEGKILVDAAYTLTTLGTKTINYDGVEREEPVTRVKSMGTRMLVEKEPSKIPDQFSVRNGDLIVTFSAKEIL
jgi:hypothetical protein